MVHVLISYKKSEYGLVPRIVQIYFYLLESLVPGRVLLREQLPKNLGEKRSLDVIYSLRGERRIRVRSQALSSGQLLTILRGTIPLSLISFGRQLPRLNGRASHLQIFYSKNCYTTHFLRQFNWVPRIQFLSC